MTYPQALEFLYSRLPMFQRIGKAAFKKDLTNILALCHSLGQPHTRYPVVHIAGTNGKGSVSHIIASVFCARGLKTGIYTSPHYKDFRERIKINNELIPEEAVIAFIQQHQALIEGIQPSFFELTVAMAFEWFARQKVDIAVIETGLGGRLDSTNIVKPELSIITNVGYDHMDMLGDTLQAIAYEKAGIIKENTPVVVGEHHPETDQVFMDVAARCNAPLYFAEDACYTALVHHDLKGMTVTVTSPAWQLASIECDINGSFQLKNINTSLMALSLLAGAYEINSNHLVEGLAGIRRSTGMIGRFYVYSEQPAIIMDGAHNVDALSLLLKDVATFQRGKLHIVFGMVRDKEPEKLMALLPKDAILYLCAANIPRAVPVDALQVVANRLKLHAKSFHSVKEALQNAIDQAAIDDMILVTGSIFITGEVL